MPRPILAEINTAALTNNLNIVRHASPHRKVWAVVKANAYGHGIRNVWKGLHATDGFALLDFEEAILLRELGWKGPILLLEGFFRAEDLALIDRYQLTTAVHSLWQLTAIANARLSRPVNVYLKINSGMNRLGFTPEQLKPIWWSASTDPNIGDITIMTHFATADGPTGVDASLAVIQELSYATGLPLCLANSAATLWHPQSHGDGIRAGIVLYGASPSGQWADIVSSGLKSVMTLRSEIIALQSLQPGSRVGYGGRYTTNTKQRIGIVACGYADGYPRHAPTGTPVMVNGVRTHLVGAVSMDMIAVDLSPCPRADIGSAVELWGSALPVDDVASSAGTLGYELLSALAPRVKTAII